MPLLDSALSGHRKLRLLIVLERLLSIQLLLKRALILKNSPDIYLGALKCYRALDARSLCEISLSASGTLDSKK